MNIYFIELKFLCCKYHIIYENQNEIWCTAELQYIEVWTAKMFKYWIYLPWLSYDLHWLSMQTAYSMDSAINSGQNI